MNWHFGFGIFLNIWKKTHILLKRMENSLLIKTSALVSLRHMTTKNLMRIMINLMTGICDTDGILLRVEPFYQMFISS